MTDEPRLTQEMIDIARESIADDGEDYPAAERLVVCGITLTATTAAAIATIIIILIVAALRRGG